MIEPASRRRPKVVAAERFELPRGGSLALATYESAGGNILYLQCKGFASASMVTHIVGHRDRAVRLGPVTIFNDLLELSGYDPPVRDELTRWQKRNGARVVATHILLRSRIVAMGIQMASLALGNEIATYVRVLEFEAELRSRVAGWSRDWDE